MGEVNEYLVLDYLRKHGRTTRPQIAADLHLSPASISRIIAKLIGNALVVESPGKSDSGGRPRRLVELNRLRECVIGIDLGGTKCLGVLANGNGDVLAEKRVQVAGAGSAYAALTDVWQALQKEAGSRGLKAGALAVGVPAVIDPSSGLAIRGPNVNWEGFDLVERLRELGLPFVVDNDVNLAAVAEGAEGQARGLLDYAVLSIGTGLGGAIVSNGQLVRGRHNAAGEIGTLLPSSRMLGELRIGGLGGMETVLAGPAIEAKARRLVETNAEARRVLTSAPTARVVIEQAVKGHAVVDGIINELIDALALCVITLAAVTDPEIIVVDGSVGRALAPLFPRLDEIVARHIPAPPRIVASDLCFNSTVRGAIAAALGLFHSADVPDVLAALFQNKVIPR